MRDGPFETPVTVELPRSKVRRIASAREAVECLLYQWPCSNGRGHRHAQMACVSALQGSKSPRYAQRAFQEAAREARILRGQAGEKKEFV
ncbi:DUF982 domain-containing protein [Aquibium oceanicum]|uniref:DUF982 domain-containing protein n=1 Tax=Aquibium oceanicum TaxID=1670800 RepID=A0A1L3SN02_9HYPH|nr:DUF982 domain-containing protein [Aquibium oceanicum]APH70750.1 hypothetical protein BSQ44_04640 [Aquibium oceanicum]